MADLEILPRCPVCGDDIPGSPRCCQRCHTPHHEECWQYVPGCAVFGCADGGAGPTAVVGWSDAHQLALEGMRWIGAATHALQATVGAFLLVIASISALGYAPLVTQALFAGCVAGVLGSMYMAFRVKWAIQGSDTGAQLRALEVEGDRHLARALQERVGRTLPLPPSLAAVVVTVPALLMIFWPALLELWRAGAPPSSYGFLAGPAALLGVALYGALKLPARWVGYQRIMANRISAAIEAGQPDKALPPP